jgi:two-component SAPR family response regulator
MDILMETVDGIEASKKIQEIAKQNNYDNLSIIVISAHDSETFKSQLGGISIVKEFVPKPFKKTKIEELINQYYYKK